MRLLLLLLLLLFIASADATAALESIFGRNAISKLQELGAVSSNPFVKVDGENLKEDYINAASLFGFANNVGALITYLMLDAMNPDNMKHREKGADKDEFVLETIRNAIDIHGILREFCSLEVIKRGQARYNPIPISESLPPEARDKFLALQERRRIFDLHDPKWSHYEMDKASFERAMLDFACAYSHPYEVLQRIKLDIPYTIEGYKKSFAGTIRKDRAKRMKRKWK
jgi:hypothetical protein